MDGELPAIFLKKGKKKTYSYKRHVYILAFLILYLVAAGYEVGKPLSKGVYGANFFF